MGLPDWDGVGVPPAIRSTPRPHPQQRDVTPPHPSRPTPNFNTEHKQQQQQEQGGRHLEPKSIAPSERALLITATAKPAPQHADFVRRHHRHVVPWVFGVVGPYSLGWHVDSVASGNTIIARNPANVSQAVRLFAVTAPGEGQAFFSDSRDHLASQILGQTVNVQSVSLDASGTMIAKIYFASSYVNARQVGDGMALYNPDQGVDLDLANAQIAAQEAGRGIWGDPSFVSDLAYDE
jgi:endonuclease YncB( thermonuclease family)